MSVCATIMTLRPEVVRADLIDAVLFQVVDCLTADDTARGDYPRPIPGLVRPKLKWTTEYVPKGQTRASGKDVLSNSR
jgi:hypothetical protein